ncbi:hypothetical protein GNY06_00430 [Elizabethkingia argentiflava]|uniref:Uncharacterized protein n=1 Tax=Elizabethkingia argenteiflava TaxID=2681556 RepID=A0A845PSF1_9FLAO|nr:hypothetical protein [Elizabethkingia argenteiflava]NAW49923.1 hypothetical protein [Elizabethkingia argenteiflava]
MENVKFSRYNNFVFYNGYYVLHNGITSNFLLLENELYSILKAAIAEEGFIYLQEIHQEF